MTSRLYIVSMKNTTKPQESTSEINRQRTQRKNAAITIVLLAIALMMPSMSNGEAVGVWDYAWASLSFIGLMALVYTVITSYRQADELQKMLQLKAAGIAFLAVVVGLFTAGLVHALADVALAPVMQIVTIAAVGLWSTLLSYLNKRSADDK